MDEDTSQVPGHHEFWRSCSGEVVTVLIQWVFVAQEGKCVRQMVSVVHIVRRSYSYGVQPITALDVQQLLSKLTRFRCKAT
jgi:hypothetical protein